MSDVSSLDRKRVQKQHADVAKVVAAEIGVSIPGLAGMIGSSVEDIQDGLLECVERQSMYAAHDDKRRQDERDQKRDPDECHNHPCKDHVDAEHCTVTEHPDGGCSHEYAGRRNYCKRGQAVGCVFRMQDAPPADPFVPTPSHAECVRILQRIGYLRPSSFGEETGTDFMLRQNTRKLWVAFVHLLVETGKVTLDPEEKAKLEPYRNAKDIAFTLGQDQAKPWFLARSGAEPPAHELRAQVNLLLAWIRGEVEWPYRCCPCGGDVNWDGRAHHSNCRFAAAEKVK